MSKLFRNFLGGTVFLVVLLSVIAVLSACGSKQAQEHKKRAEAEVIKKGNELYDVYITGDLKEARAALKHSLELLENADLSPHGQATGLYFTYSRLYVLEKRVGNEALSEAALVKARYWLLRRLELGGASADEASAKILAYTPKQCFEFVDKWDKDHTDAKGPKYNQQIK